VFACVVRGLEAWRVPRWVRAAITGVFALIAGEWDDGGYDRRDVPYTIANLALFGILLETVRTRGEYLGTRSGMFALWLVLTSLSLFRHNGIVAAIIMLILLRAVYRRNVDASSDRRRELRCNFPRRGRPDLSHSRRSADRPRVKLQYVLHQIAALVHDDLQLTAASGTY